MPCSPHFCQNAYIFIQFDMMHSRLCQPYIESATTLSDYYYYYYEKIARISGFCPEAEMDFQHLVGPRNVSVELKYDVLSL